MVEEEGEEVGTPKKVKFGEENRDYSIVKERALKLKMTRKGCFGGFLTKVLSQE